MTALPSLPPLDELQRYSVIEAEQYLRVSRARIYQRIAAGEISTVKDGRRLFIPGSEIVRLSRAAA